MSTQTTDTHLIITQACMGLWRDEEGAVQHCERAMGHAPECGPDSQNRSYVEPQAAEEHQEPERTGVPTAVRMMEWIAGRNAEAHGYGRHIGSHTTAVLMAFAALYDKHGRPVYSSEIAAVVGNAPSTVKRHLDECPVVKGERGQWTPGE